MSSLIEAFEVVIGGFKKTTSLETIKEVFQDYETLSFDIERYNADTLLDKCLVQLTSKEEVKNLIKEKNKTKYNGATIYINKFGGDKTRKSVIINGFGANKTDKDMKEFLEEYPILSFERLIGKKGEMKSGIVGVIVKNTEIANRITAMVPNKFVEGNFLKIIDFKKVQFDAKSGNIYKFENKENKKIAVEEKTLSKNVGLEKKDDVVKEEKSGKKGHLRKNSEENEKRGKKQD
ncbi:hypothetical protein EIN_432580 [Entamoeba invadens IP1]|uniref:RRM domain-containing protein n=1 Tax=Entamoeba invadens IP1 TaxID=370355 RepID=A0A0A1UCQ8_ENTIV|nr:hypothetical protein EIN_432580 [Entamoeba invadens IP1]ELP93706.1 hypothetical protein EIN_432580 [Entamoeba invadens IP1]|eukprot:XP_004260477.1 hypothetical protein EIN_432580 [Entamoeba invadens IP1]